MKHGFTLIELLAVIALLSVISLIVTPITFGIIESSEKKSYEITCNEIYKSYSNYEVNIETNENTCNVFDFASKRENVEYIENVKYIPISELELEGELPIKGTYKICNGKKELVIFNGKYTCIKDENSMEIKKGDMTNGESNNPIITDVTFSTTTNSIRLIVNVSNESNDIVKYYYKIDGEESISESNIKLYDGLEKNKEYEIEIIIEDKDGLKSESYIKKISTKNLNNPVIKQIAQTPDNEKLVTSRVIQITYNGDNVSNPEYYFKSSSSATVSEGIVTDVCGTNTIPGQCVSSNVITLEANTWYKTNNLTPSIIYRENGILYALISDGKNISGTSTYNVNNIDSSLSNKLVITTSDNILSNNWHNADFSITLSSTNANANNTYYYGTTANPDILYDSKIDINTETKETIYYFKLCSSDNNCSSVKSYIVKLDKTPPEAQFTLTGVTCSDNYEINPNKKGDTWTLTGTSNITKTYICEDMAGNTKEVKREYKYNSCKTGSNTCQGGYNQVWNSCASTKKECTTQTVVDTSNCVKRKTKQCSACGADRNRCKTWGPWTSQNCQGTLDNCNQLKHANTSSSKFRCVKLGSCEGFMQMSTCQSYYYAYCDSCPDAECETYGTKQETTCKDVCQGGYVNGSWNSCITGSNTCSGGFE